MFKGENLLDMEPEERSVAGLFLSFQSPVEIPGVSNMDFLRMAYNARRRKLGLEELDPFKVHILATLNVQPNVDWLVGILYSSFNYQKMLAYV